MRKALWLLPLAWATLGCRDDGQNVDDIPPDARTGGLEVYLEPMVDDDLMDPRLDEVWIRVESVEVQHEDEGWVTLSDTREDFDLLGSGRAMESSLLGEGDTYVGGYDAVRMAISDSWLVLDGEELGLGISGLDPLNDVLVAGGTFFVDEGSLTTVTVSWDLVEELDEGDNGDWTLGTNTALYVDVTDDPGAGDE